MGDSRVQGLRQDAPPIAYTPLAQTRYLAFGAPALILQLASKPPDLGPRAADHSPGDPVREWNLHRGTDQRPARTGADSGAVVQLLGGLVLLLACIGLYGVLYHTSRVGDTTEISGSGSALGARPPQVVNMVLREFSIVVVLGLAVGIAAALELSLVPWPILVRLGTE